MIKVYWADAAPLADPSVFSFYFHLMDEERQRKIEGFRFEKDRRLSLGAGILLKKALENEGIADARLSLTERGKPYLAHYPDLFFNLSHSGRKVLCAVGHIPVGCDIEEIGEAPLQIVPRIFSEEEQACLKKSDSESLSRQFYRLWTGKESFVKMSGEGIGHLTSFSVELPFHTQKIRGRTVTFFEIPCGGAYQGTLCAEGRLGMDEIEVKEADLKVWQKTVHIAE